MYRLLEYMGKNSRQFCGERAGFGGNCIQTEEMTTLWMQYYEVSNLPCHYNDIVLL